MARKLPQGEAYILFKPNPAVTRLVFDAESCHARHVRHVRRVWGGKLADRYLYFPEATADEASLDEPPAGDWF